MPDPRKSPRARRVARLEEAAVRPRPRRSPPGGGPGDGHLRGQPPPSLRPAAQKTRAHVPLFREHTPHRRSRASRANRSIGWTDKRSIYWFTERSCFLLPLTLRRAARRPRERRRLRRRRRPQPRVDVAPKPHAAAAQTRTTWPHRPRARALGEKSKTKTTTRLRPAAIARRRRRRTKTTTSRRSSGNGTRCAAARRGRPSQRLPIERALGHPQSTARSGTRYDPPGDDRRRGGHVHHADRAEALRHRVGVRVAKGRGAVLLARREGFRAESAGRPRAAAARRGWIRPSAMPSREKPQKQRGARRAGRPRGYRSRRSRLSASSAMPSREKPQKHRGARRAGRPRGYRSRRSSPRAGEAPARADVAGGELDARKRATLRHRPRARGVAASRAGPARAPGIAATPAPAATRTERRHGGRVQWSSLMISTPCASSSRPRP